MLKHQERKLFKNLRRPHLESLNSTVFWLNIAQMAGIFIQQIFFHKNYEEKAYNMLHIFVVLMVNDHIA